MTRSILTLIPALCLLGSGCSNEEEEHEGYEDVILDGDVTDETMIGLANALEADNPAASSTSAPTLDSPTDGAALPAETIPTFSWHVGTSALVARLAPTSTEPAHGDPYSGYATYLEFTVGGETPVQVLTSELSWTPTTEAWDELAAAGQPITLTLVGAEFEQDRVLQDGGPYAGSTIEFEVTP